MNEYIVDAHRIITTQPQLTLKGANPMNSQTPNQTPPPQKKMRLSHRMDLKDILEQKIENSHHWGYLLKLHFNYYLVIISYSYPQSKMSQ